MNENPFELLKKSAKSKARLGVIHTAHGDVTTPVFMPVGTAATVKGLTSRDIRELDAEIILANTYHLYLRPGTKLIAEAGGVQKFMSWNKPMLTDSGGFQVWSLKQFRKITEEGVQFKSLLDGSRHLFTPASVMNAQREIGADIIMAFDECTPYPSTVEEAEKSLALTLKWTREAKEWLLANPPIHGYPQFFFGIVQGGMHKELRQKSIEALKEIEPDGYAMGGLSVGEPVETMYEIADFCTNLLPEDRARYVMGVGTPWNLLELVKRGVDMCDCILPAKCTGWISLYKPWRTPLQVREICAPARFAARPELRLLLLSKLQPCVFAPSVQGKRTAWLDACGDPQFAFLHPLDEGRESPYRRRYF